MNELPLGALQSFDQWMAVHHRPTSSKHSVPQLLGPESTEKTGVDLVLSCTQAKQNKKSCKNVPLVFSNADLHYCLTLSGYIKLYTVTILAILIKTAYNSISK